MIDGRRTKNNRGIVHKNGVDNVNRDLDNQNFEGNCANSGLSQWRGHPTPFHCAKTVSELDLLGPPGLLFERKQIPRFVVNIRILRIAMEPLEATRLPWAQGVGRSNRPAPTNGINRMRILSRTRVQILQSWRAESHRATSLRTTKRYTVLSPRTNG